MDRAIGQQGKQSKPRRLLVDLEAVDTDHDLLTALHGQLILVRRLLDLPLLEALLDGGDLVDMAVNMVRAEQEEDLAEADWMLESRLETALARVGLGAVDPRAALGRLSGGQQRRAALAALFFDCPEIVLLDEPTAGLDPIAATEFDELINYLRDNLDLTIFMITHDVDSLFNTCDRIAVLVDKQIRVGPAEEIVADGHPWIREYFGAPRTTRAWQAREAARHG